MATRLRPFMDRIFHLADAENWPLIQRDGLRNTSELIEQAGLSEREAQVFRSYRPHMMRLPSGAIIRDQRPMPPSSLLRCLQDGLTPQDWYDLVNSKVFFWIDAGRLLRHAAACAPRPQILVTVDARRLFECYAERAFVTAFNVGNARRRPAPRSQASFVPWRTWLSSRWASEVLPGHRMRPPSHPPAELAVGGSIPNFGEFVIEARSIAGS